MTRFSAKTTTIILAAALLVGVTAGALSKWRESRGVSCVDIAGAACSTCRNSAKAKFCEASYIVPEASGNIMVNGQKGCCGFMDPKLRKSCEEILRCVRTTGCAVGNDPVRCFCGDVPAMVCGAGAKPPNGPCLAAYTAGLEGGPPGTALKLFGSPTSPLGIANNTFTCDVDSSCPCGMTKSGMTKK